MNVNEIKNPQFLKRMSIDELNHLSNDIRSFLIENISKTGGHLSSNLGIVELTIALHYCFNAPKDKILFDVGHQSYVHKILTGRANQMDKLRCFDGLSGFQCRNESVYDCFEAGHSSTALSTALGMAVSRDLNDQKFEVTPVVGDGAIMSGLSLEALNQIGYEKKKLIIVFNDNNMSISKNVGALSKSFASLRSSNAYNELKINVKDILKDKRNGEKIIGDIRSFKNVLKKQILNSGIFKEFNIDYLGPIDGHDIQALIKAFRKAQSTNGPIVVHVITKKGKGYKYAENDPNGKWHGVSKFNIDTGKPVNEVPQGYQTYSKFVASCILDLMSKNKQLVTITPAMISGSCLNEIFATYPERAFDCGIAEDHALTFASGLALNGSRPFVSIYSSFLQRAYDQLNHDICRMDLPVTIGIDRSGLVGEDGSSHHGVFDISFMSPLPNLIISEGKDADEIRDLIFTSLSLNHPFAIRYPRGLLKVNNNNYNLIKIGTWKKANRISKPKAIIITYGHDVDEINDIVKLNKLPYLVVNARFIKPIDTIMLNSLAKLSVPLFVYNTDIKNGGLGQIISSYYHKNNINVTLHDISINDQYVKFGNTKQLKESLNLDIDSLLKYIKKELNA